MEALLVNYVEKSLEQYMRRNAVFLCERLYAEFPSEVNLQLLARCYLNNNQPHSAYYILKGMQMAQSRYLFAIACLEMDLFCEAEAALLPVKDLCAEVPNGAAVQYLLGIIYRDTDRKNKSIEHFRKTLSIDPMFWAAYEQLCMLGEAEEAAVCFGDATVPCVQEHYLGNASSCLQIADTDHSSDSSQRFGLEYLSRSDLKQREGNNIRVMCENNHGGPILTGAVRQSKNSCCSTSFLSTPSPVPTQLSDVAPPPLVRNIHLRQSEDSLRPNTQARGKFACDNESAQIRGSLFFDSGLRRSARLAVGHRSLNTSQGSENKAKSLHASTKLSSETCSSTFYQGKLMETYEVAVSEFGATSSSLSSTTDVKSIQHEIENTKLSSFISDSATIKSGISNTMKLLRTLGEGYRHLCMFRCKEALNVYQKLSSKQYNTGWILSQVGKAYFELVDYLNADYAFSLARQISPYNLEEMDVYSTVLYHLKQDMKLKYLAQEMILVDRFAPQTWCAIGNCYSLQKDHESALKSFQRAVQLNSRFAYAHTLSGHEYVIMEDYGKGVECYQTSLHVDARHYNSWYGLGMIYLCQEKFEFAEHHFRQAYQINPLSSVIMYYLGTTLEVLKRSEEALEMMETAIVIDNKNPLPKYSKAKLLLTLGKLNEALEILEELKECTPRESCIYALMGEIYKRNKKYDKAMLHFGIALDLKPSIVDVAKIEAAIEKLIIPDEMEESL
ncbi:cell division cycle protein 27 homolog B-like [Gossypium arboreum]|uniref:cell division cycle protein 27 homolog B-like n=1 Tax=Gossypium arboreum TaxID=29729 RepID=UPI0008191B59|nr:cell division cycle protein 27 homolog B-like [Gossypium arboreum]